MTQKRLYLSLTVQSNGQFITMPLTPLLLAMWLMAAFPALAQFCQTIDQLMTTTDMVVASIVVAILAFVMNVEVKLCYS